MHRSGTSALAGLLQQAGVEFGSVARYSPHNRKGNREHPEIMALNEALLAHNGWRWDQTDGYLVKLQWNRSLAHWRDRIILAHRDEPLWGFKDPRTLLTLAFWLDGLQEHQVTLLATFRHPLAVAQSLQARHPQQLTISHGVSLWVLYNRLLAYWQQQTAVASLHFDLPAEAYTQAARRLLERCCHHALAPSAAPFFDPQLRHQQACDEAWHQVEPAASAVEAQLLYQQLLHHYRTQADLEHLEQRPFFDAPAQPPQLSIIVIFYNMRREAIRTLYSLTRYYQQNVNDLHYEIIALDNGSSQPLDRDHLAHLGSQIRYAYFPSAHPAPCAALNYGVRLARAARVMCLIDGARILSPGVIDQTMKAFQHYQNPFIYTLSMHLGAQPQNQSIQNGYNQAFEDGLLRDSGWEQAGYQLFDNAVPALSSGHGFYANLTESNCIALSKEAYHALGGFDERFISPGGGLANHDFFQRAVTTPTMQPVLLLGEASFHQFHGGVATNVALAEHPWPRFAAEYEQIRGYPYQEQAVQPEYFGRMNVWAQQSAGGKG
jgi:hypothetical protein